MTVAVPGGDDAALRRTDRVFQRGLSWGLGALGFFLLWSTAGTSISMFVLALLCLLAPGRIWRTRTWREPVAATGLLLFAYIALRTFVGEGFSSSTVSAVNHYHELLMMPVLWALFRLAERPQAFANGLIAGSLLVAVLVWIAPVDPMLTRFMDLRRISAGFGLAVVAYLLFEHARLGRLPRLLGYGLALFLAVTVVFGNESRTGVLVLLLLLVCAGFRAAPPRWRLAAAVLMLGGGVLLAACSERVRGRALETLQAVHPTAPAPAPDAANSTNLRLALLHSGVVVAREHWALGVGWARYPDAFAQASANTPVGDVLRKWLNPNNPHTEYLLQLGAGGLPALLLFLAWLAAPVWLALRHRRLESPWAGAAGCIAIAFALSALFNSVLRDFVEAHFYTSLMAWLLVRRVND